jgi:hypothetical protein
MWMRELASGYSLLLMRVRQANDGQDTNNNNNNNDDDNNDDDNCDDDDCDDACQENHTQWLSDDEPTHSQDEHTMCTCIPSTTTTT